MERLESMGLKTYRRLHRSPSGRAAVPRVCGLCCARRGITVHWDAQNEASRDPALKLGYEVSCEYEVFLG